jgi:ribosomal protein S18 acetylase RimI-like enzyme
MPAILELRRAIAAAQPGSIALAESELRERYLEPMPGWRRKFTVWEEDGRLVGMLEAHTSELPDRENEYLVYLVPRIHPDLQEGGLGEEVIAFGEDLARAWRGPDVETEISAYRDAEWAVRLLGRHGYVPARTFERMAIDDVGATLPVPDVPGYAIRPLAGEAEIDAWVALYDLAFRDHFDFHPITREQRLVFMNQQMQVPELDLVAVAPDGGLAAFCWTVLRDEDGGRASWYVDLVGTHPEHRRRGLAGALLSETLVRVLKRGGGRIYLEVDSESETGANRLYERLGFRVETATIDFRKRLGR